MEQTIEKQDDAASLDLGRLIGRRDALAAVAGRCSAAEALTFQRIREGKLYKEIGLTWEECCDKLGVNRRQVERILNLLDEFGPQYFELSRIKHVTVEEYRRIGSRISAEGVCLDGMVIALLPDNREEVSAAVDELLKREEPAARETASTVKGMQKRCEALTSAIEKMAGEFTPLEAVKMTIAISRLRSAAARKGAQTL